MTKRLFLSIYHQNFGGFFSAEVFSLLTPLTLREFLDMRRLTAPSLNILLRIYFYGGSFFVLPLHCTGSVDYNTRVARILQWEGF